MTSQLFVLEPTYQACRPAVQSVAGLGTIFVADLTADEGLVAVVEAATRLATEPWCPLALITNAPELDHPTQAVIDQFDLDPAVVTPDDADPLSPAPILQAVRQRRFPSSRRLARHVTQRAARPDLEGTLQECFRRALEGEGSGPGLSRSTLSRRLLGFGPLKARDWSGMARTLEVLLDPGAHLGPSARLHDIDPRTVRSHIKLYTGLDYSDARKRPGWEWVVESALRRWGYVEPVAVPASARRQRVRVSEGA